MPCSISLALAPDHADPPCAALRRLPESIGATQPCGIERSLFRTNETGGRSSVVRLAQGSPFRAMLTTEQKRSWSRPEACVSEESTLKQGDYLFTEPGKEHDVVAISDAAIFVSSQKKTPIIE